MTLRGGHSIRLLQGAAAFFPALVRAIEGSQYEVRLETFIFHFEGAALQVAEALERAAARGVAVYVVMDAIGTPQVPETWQRRFATAGVQWARFSPLGLVGWLNPVRWRRLHRKLCVVDQTLGFCGGVNLVDDWLEPGHGALDAPRYDFALQLQGPLVADIQNTLVQLWRRLSIQRDLGRGRLLSAGQVWKQGRTARQSSLSGSKAHTPEWAEFDDIRATLLLRDNVRNRSGIERAYRQAIGSARHEIILANAYFLPGRRLRKALVLARSRGVRVRLLVQGRYDNFMQFHASRPVMAAMCAKGIEVYEYTPSLLHAKVSVIDGQWATIGSSNLDPLSLLLAREANIVLQSESLASALRAQLDLAMDDAATPLDQNRLAQRSLWHRVLDRLAFAVMRTMLFVTGFRY
ncbi:MAG: cardiolipin synthase B [Burkholderiales bacterium PBB4]|nr:MAG: cardiolipin synthase B [Burkholderiales bacterium PBB4]